MNLDNAAEQIETLGNHIRNTITTHLGNDVQHKRDIFRLFLLAHMSCERGEWEDDGELLWHLVNKYNVTDDNAKELIKAFTDTTLVNDESALDE